MTTRESTPDDLDRLLALRNAIFPAITRAGWEREQPITACLAFDGEDLVGALPLAFREIRIGAGRTITTVFENAVGTRADYRGRGVGSAMIKAITEFIRGRADALFVYRGDERSIGYSFYRKTGHVDVHYTRRFILPTPPTALPPTPDVVIQEGLPAVLAHEPECLPLFQATYGRHGGFRERTTGFYQKALEGLIYECHPQQFFLFQYRQGHALLGYAIVGVPLRAADTPLVSILEMATADGIAAHARPLLAAIARLAGERNRAAHCVTSDASPFAAVLAASGFEPQLRHHMTMAILVDPAATARKVWISQAAFDAAHVVAWTPSGECPLHVPTDPASRTVRLEMKDETLTRLLLGRVRVSAAVAMELITATGLETADLAALDAALPFAPWCYHAIDYI